MYGVISAFIIFMTLMVSFAIVASNHPINLVIDDYYKAEVAFQGQIDKMKNLDSLGEKPQVEFVADAGSVMIQMPEKLSDEPITGQLKFYRPDGSVKDIQMTLLPNATGRQLVSAEQLERGRWKVQLDWTAGGRDYYYEEGVDIK